MLTDSTTTISIVSHIINHLPALIDIFGAIFMALIVWFARQYLAPYFKVERSRRYAEYIAAIADDVTDDLVCSYPDKEWVKRLDEAVDKIMAVCGVEGEIARRVASAALSRKPRKEPV